MSSQAYQNNNSNTHYNIINFEHKRNTTETSMLIPPNSRQLPAMVSKSLSSSSTPTVGTVSSSGSPTTSLRTKVSEPPAFEKGIANEISANFGQMVQVIFIKPLRIKIAVEPHNIIKVAIFLRDKFGFDHAESVAGTDYPKENQIEVIYHLGSYTRDDLAGHVLSLATRTNREDARLPTLINVYKSAEYHERETFEMLGVYFEGHPRNERFLLPEDWADIPPLRKEFRIKGR
ncbi:MAG TPA: NADH-quinone oxidoreductase subunit C [Candidatus Bathyarchaeia archaeon]|nr:NADH-quinone oxidoreductase subunit C [Candidatus Bathyarchaeia archaeon]